MNLSALETMAFDSSHPLLLNGRNELWEVAHGQVDLFSVAIRDGKPVGAREHICRLQAGQYLPGLGDGGGSFGMGLLAVGLPDTRLACLAASLSARAGLAAEHPEEVASAFDEWLVMLNVVLRQSSAMDSLFEEADKEDHEGVVWLVDPSGEALIPALVWMPMQQVRSRTVVLPLNLQAWMTASGEGDLVCQNSAALISAGSLQTALDSYHNALLEAIIEQSGQRQSTEAQRLVHKHELEAQRFGDALAGLTQIMDESSDQCLPFSAWTGLAAVDACLLVMEASGIRSPLPSGEKIDPAIHTVENLTLRSRAASRQVTITGERWWLEDAGPLLAARKDGSPVALLPRGRQGYWLVDPTDRSRVALTQENSAGLGDTALTFFRTFPSGQPIGIKEAFRLGKVGIGGDFRRLLAVGLLGGLLGLLVPFGTGLLIDNVIPNAQSSELLQLVLLLFTATLGISAFELTRAIAMLRIMDGGIGNAVQMAVIHRLLYLPAVFFRRYSAGDLANRALGIGLIFRQFNTTTQAAVLSWFFGLASLICLFFINHKLAWLAVLLAVLVIALFSGLNYWRLSLERRKYRLQGALASRVFQLLNGIGKLHANGAEKRAFALWAADFAKQKALDYQARRISNIIIVIESGYPVLASALLFGITAFALPNLSTGDFIFFNTAFTQFLTATLAMFNALTMLIPVIPLYERAQPILNTLPEMSAAHKSPGLLTGAIDLNLVTFRYMPDGPTILRHLSINIKPGEFIAFVGPSGSGKSTIYRLLLGFDRPESGAVYYDGQDLSGLDIGAVRKQLGVVLQNGKLMAGDIFSNIVGSAPLTMDDAWEAARIAGLEADIKAMPMGMHTVIAEGAGTLSGGQKQRLMIARAVVNKPRILLFDEATSALDNHTQGIVSQSIEHLNATRIVIAHRLSTIQKADRIFVIETGQVSEFGTYGELMAKGGAFTLLAQRQLL
ncbi:MAG: NHLP bacteriocin export ABC transporter permease/ATPase subunit [Methylovulum sp.]|nr:NHLP bacteriocin export ABC transporter permease/ATPase subunit [Methylovulum sp.]